MSTNEINQLLEIQQNAYREATNMLFSSLNERIEAQNKLIYDLKLSLEFSQKELEETKSELKICKSDLKNINETLIEKVNKINKLEENTTKLEDYSRRNNLRIEGVTENQSENWEETQAKVNKIIKDKLLISNIKVDYAHRLSRPQSASLNGPRTIIARLSHDTDRNRIMKTSWKLKNSGIYMNEDLSDASSKKRKEKIPELKSALAAGKIAFFSGSKLIVKERKTPQPQDNSSKSTEGTSSGVKPKSKPHENSSGLSVDETTAPITRKSGRVKQNQDRDT